MLSTIIVLITVLGNVYGMNPEHENLDRIPDVLLKVERRIFYGFSANRWRFEDSKTNSMLHNGLLDLMNRSTCFGHYYAHRQELATIQMVSAFGSSPWLRQVAGLVPGCRFWSVRLEGYFTKHTSNLT